MNNPSSQFASRVFRGDAPNDEPTPGPGSYQGLSDIKKARWLQASVLDRGAKRVGFGSQAERKTYQALIHEEQLPSDSAVASRKKLAQASSTFQIETYDTALAEDDWRDEATSPAAMDTSLSRKHLTAGSSTTKSAIGRGAAGVGVLHSSTNRRQKQQNQHWRWWHQHCNTKSSWKGLVWLGQPLAPPPALWGASCSEMRRERK